MTHDPHRAPNRLPPNPRGARPMRPGRPQSREAQGVVVDPRRIAKGTPPDRHRPRFLAEGTRPRSGQIVVVFGCRGGAGATTLAVNLAAALQQAGRSVCVVDLDLQLGDVFVALDLETPTSLAALAKDIGDLDRAAVMRRLARHESGICAVGQSERLVDLDSHFGRRLPRLLDGLRRHFDYVIVDGVRHFGDHELAALDVADHVFLVATQDVASVRRAARVLRLSRQIGLRTRCLSVVLNRAVRKSVIDEATVARVLGMPIAARVRNDYKRARVAFDDGALLADVAHSKGISKDIAMLARHVELGRARQDAGARP